MSFTPIHIPQNNRKVWREVSKPLYAGSTYSSVTTDAQLTHECEKWLEANVGIRDFSPFGDEAGTPSYGCWQLRKSYHSIAKAEPTPIYFSRKSDAMLFKLTWL